MIMMDLMSVRLGMMGLSGVECGHDATQEGVEQRNGEGDVAVGGAIDHPLGDKLVANRAKAWGFPPKLCRDISGAIRAGTKFSHSPQVGLL